MTLPSVTTLITLPLSIHVLRVWPVAQWLEFLVDVREVVVRSHPG